MFNMIKMQDDQCLISTNIPGSEEDDSDDGSEDEPGLAPLLIPRVARVYLPEDDYEENREPVAAQANFQWPPSSCLLSDTSAPFDPSAPSEPLAPSEPSVSFGPQKFNFEWKGFPQPQILPELRREPFLSNPGPTSSYASPYSAFVAIWDTSIMEHIATETNRYAQQLAATMMLDGITPKSRITQWHDTDVDELYVYFAIIQAMGIVVKSRLQEYWNKSKNIFSTPEFSLAMSFDRFILLNKCLHFNDNSRCNPGTMANAEAKLYKILPIVNHLNDRFGCLYTLNRNILIDESLTKWKGFLNINQFKHNKGIKTYEVCESQTGYLWRFKVHVGPATPSLKENSPISGFVSDIVLKLLHGLEHKGHTVWMDWFYNSPELARELKVRGFDCAGTLSINCQAVPMELKELKVSEMAVGEISGCTAGDVDLIVWGDTKRIALISTYHGIATVKCGDRLKPVLLCDYNICMGGADKKDQLLAMYPIERSRSRIWYKKFFRRILNTSVLNAHILYNANQQMEHRRFRHTLVLQLLERHKKAAPARSVSVENLHVQGFFPKLNTADNRHCRRKCTLCPRRVPTNCVGCGVALCVPDCFSKYHLSSSVIGIE